MKYHSVSEAKQMSGLRLALSVGGPFAFGQSVKSILEIKGIPYSAVTQLPGQSNDELFAWTGFRNAPVAIYEDESPKTDWTEILYLAERLEPLPRLIPKDTNERALMFGLGHKICAKDGFGWSCRLLLVQAMLTTPEESPVRQLGEVLGERYGYSDSAAAEAPSRATEILSILAHQLEIQGDAGSEYFVGSELTAVDIYWAAFATMIAPLPEPECPIDADSRASFVGLGHVVEANQYPALIEHRDMIYSRHLKLPMDF
jgi:glutathione S-transferase